MNKIEQMIHDQILDYLKSDGCNPSAALTAAKKGVEHFKKGNLKDPYFDSLCHAGMIWAQHHDGKYKFKKPKKVGGKPFSYGKPKARKHPKDQEALF